MGFHLGGDTHDNPRPSFRLWTGTTSAVCRSGNCAVDLCVDLRPLARCFGPIADISAQLKGMSRELVRQALPPAVARVYYYPRA